MTSCYPSYSPLAMEFSREQSAQATFTDLQKKKFVCNQKFHTLSHPTSKLYLFLTARGRSKDILSICWAKQENLCTHPLAYKTFIPWIHIRNKKIKP